jgi:uncharacterized membrane protein
MKSAVATLIVAMLAGSASAQPSLQSFGPAAGTSPFLVLGLSGNGQFVCGKSGLLAFRWSVGAGMQTFSGFGPIQGQGAWATAVSDDGTVAGYYWVFRSTMGNTWTEEQAVRWSPSLVDTRLFDVEGNQHAPCYTRAMGISHAATVIAGGVFSGIVYIGPIARTSITVPLPHLPGDELGSGDAVSGDGTVIAGYTRAIMPEYRHACVWPTVSAVVPLPSLGQPSSWATAASYDGSVIVGNCGPIPVRWSGGSVAALDVPPGTSGVTYTTAVSGDGTIIVGVAGAKAVMWTQQGVQALRDFFISQGLNLTDWDLQGVRGISRDGRVFAGWGTYLGSPRAWVITLPQCYANCDGSTAAPILNVNDFSCFLSRHSAGDTWANCDASTLQPVLNVNDFLCFLNRFGAGCP